MAKIIIRNLFGKEVPANDSKKSILEHFQAEYVDWMHSCGAKGRCTTCKVIVIEGMTNLGPLTPAEIRYRDNKALKQNERLSCQTPVQGDVIVSAPSEYKLPHITYSD